MSFFAYLYQLKISFRKFFYSNKAFIPTHEESKCAEEVNANFNHNLKLKCKKSALEIQYIQSFTHWPITEAKKTKRNAIVYLDSSRNKRATMMQENQLEIKKSEATDKANLANKLGLIKKLR
jgi:hypothetical protein